MGKFFVSALILVLSFTTLTGCFDRKEIDDQTYIIAIGLDKGTIMPLKLTLQYAVPQALGTGGGSGGGGAQGGKIIQNITLDAPSLNAGLNMANGFIGKQVNVSHTVLVVCSEKLAKEGVSKFFYGIARARQFRPGMFIAVSRENAEDYLKSINPTQEVDPSKYYELIFREYRNTGFTPNADFIKFYSAMESLAQQPYAVLAGVSKYKSSDQFNINRSTAPKKGRKKPFEGDFEAGDIPQVGAEPGEIMGLAVFNGDKFVGEIDGQETRNFLMVTGNYKAGFITFPDPMEKEAVVVLNVKQSRNPTYKCITDGEEPEISIKLQLEADIASIQSGINYESPNNMPVLEAEAKRFILFSVECFLERTTKNFNCDICGFGKQVRKKFLTYKEWEDYKWLDKYSKTKFNVDVDVKIRRPGLQLRSNPMVSTQREETDNK